jgi:hypothetical protein
LGGEHAVVGINNVVFKQMMEYCKVRGIPFQQFVSKYIAKALLEVGAGSEKALKAIVTLSEMDGDFNIMDEVKKRYTKLDFYDGFSEENWKDKEKELVDAGADDDYVEMSRKIYAGSKRKCEQNRERLKALVDLVYEEPKQLGKTPEEWRKAHQKPVEQKEELDVTEPEQELEQCKHKRTEILNIRKNGKTELKCLDCGLKMLGKGRDQGEH